MNRIAEPPDHRRREKRGGAAAEMHLRDAPVRVEQPLHQRQLSPQEIDIIGGGIAFQRDHRCAAAKPAQRLAERQVKIKRERAPGILVVPADGLDQRPGGRRLRELRRGRIGCVARPRNVVFPHQF